MTNVESLKKLYTKLGGDAADVADVSLISEMIDKISDVAESGGAEYPAGGTTGQALCKKTDADNDVEWATVLHNPEGGGDDGSVLTMVDGSIAWVAPAVTSVNDQTGDVELEQIGHLDYTESTATSLWTLLLGAMTAAGAAASKEATLAYDFNQVSTMVEAELQQGLNVVEMRVTVGDGASSVKDITFLLSSYAKYGELDDEQHSGQMEYSFSGTAVLHTSNPSLTQYNLVMSGYAKVEWVQDQVTSDWELTETTSKIIVNCRELAVTSI